MPTRARLFAAVALAACPLAAAAAETVKRPMWVPAKTWVFAVGILEWKDAKSWPPFPAARNNRADRRLVEWFRDRGVPADRVVYLEDRQAPLKQIRSRFADTLAKVGPDELLVFYFAGHGSFDADTKAYSFANYDARKADGSDLWSVRSVAADVAARFRGGRVLFLADCCYSGGLVAELDRSKLTVPAAVLTSAFAHNTSTGGWTFTEAVLRGFRGDPQLDADDDGVVGLGELARHAGQEMAFVEDQKSVFVTRNDFPAGLGLSPARGRRDPAVGRHVEVKWTDGKWWKAAVTAEGKSGTTVRYVADESTEVVTDPARVRPYRPPVQAEGAKVRVVWEDGKVYPATVRRSWYGMHLVHYPGYGPEYDEWVPQGRLRK